MQQVPDNNRIVFYDGDCALCSKAVIFLLKVDQKKRLKFAPLSGVTSKSFLIDKAATQQPSLVFLRNRILYYRSTAVLKIAQDLPLPWNLLGIFFLIPSFLRNYIYNIIGKNRYKWFGKNKVCMLNFPEHENRFLD